MNIVLLTGCNILDTISWQLSNAFKISVEVLVKLLKTKPQSSLQDKFCARSRATGKTDGYSFAVPSSANG